MPVKRWRVWMVWALAAVLVLGHSFDIVTLTEHWPFSYYQMYARVQKNPQLELLSLCAIVQDGKRQRQVRITESFVPQLGEARMRNILMASWGRPTRPNRNAARDVSAILRDYLKMYESRRVAGLHDGPPMLEAQLCRITWKLKPDGSESKQRIEPLLGMRATGRPLRYFESTPTTTSPTTQEHPDATSDAASD